MPIPGAASLAGGWANGVGLRFRTDVGWVGWCFERDRERGPCSEFVWMPIPGAASLAGGWADGLGWRFGADVGWVLKFRRRRDRAMQERSLECPGDEHRKKATMAALGSARGGG